MKKALLQNSIQAHYRRTDLQKNIREAFHRAGRRIENYTDTESIDEFHIRGREATRELARLAELRPGMSVLDLGCGVGGPARMLAAEFGCMVTGVDLMAEYCETAAMITEKAGLSHRVCFQQGDMARLTFADQSFDAAMVLHTLMNIAEKSALFDRIYRILKPGGLFLLYEVCESRHSPLYFPVPWATDASMSFLLCPEDLRQCLKATGFEEIHWLDVTSEAIEWFQAMARKPSGSLSPTGKGKPDGEKSRPGMSLILGDTAAEKSGNVYRNLSEERMKTIFGVFRKA